MTIKVEKHEGGFVVTRDDGVPDPIRSLHVRGNNPFNDGWLARVFGVARESCKDDAWQCGWDTANETSEARWGWVITECLKRGHILVSFPGEVKP